MKDVYETRSFKKNQRTPTVEKVRRDGINMYCEARYVIVLDNGGSIIERINRSATWEGNFLVVLAPVVYQGHYIELSVILEIGFGRSVPYKQFERLHNGVVVATKDRIPIAKLSESTLVGILPTIGVAIQDVVDEDISHRKNHVRFTRMTPAGDLAWGGKIIFTGKFITLPEEYPVISYICLEKALQGRSRSHLAQFAQITREKLSKLKYAYYPKNEIKRFKVVQEIVPILRQANYPSHFVEIIRTKLGKETTKVRALFEQIVEVYKISFRDVSTTDPLYAKLSRRYHRRRKNLLTSFPITTVTHPKREQKKHKSAIKNGTSHVRHAKKCLRVEVLPSKKAIAKKNPKGNNGNPVINL